MNSDGSTALKMHENSLIGKNRGAPITIDKENIQNQGVLSQKGVNLVINSREEIDAIQSGKDDRLLVTCGPCSITETNYQSIVEAIVSVREEIKRNILIVFRMYSEKPRTVSGEKNWKGLRYAPTPNTKYSTPDEGIINVRKICKELIEDYKLPLISEVLETTNFYELIEDYLSIGIIGARSALNPGHREMASGSEIAFGIKNGTDGKAGDMINGILSAMSACIYTDGDKTYPTYGNKKSFGVLRGGDKGPNYSEEQIREVTDALNNIKQLKNNPIMVDCSHDNSVEVGEGGKPIIKEGKMGLNSKKWVAEKFKFSHIREIKLI